MIGFEDPDFSNEAGATDAMAEMFEYAGHLAKLRRENPLDDLTSVLLHAEIDGEWLDELGFNMFFMLLILAGNETTRNAISDMEVCGPVRRLRSTTVNSIKSMPVRFTPES